MPTACWQASLYISSPDITSPVGADTVLDAVGDEPPLSEEDAPRTTSFLMV